MAPPAAPAKAKKTWDTIAVSQDPAPTAQQPFTGKALMRTPLKVTTAPTEDYGETDSMPSDDDDSVCPSPMPAPASIPTGIGQVLKKAVEMLGTMRIKGNKVTIRDAVITMLEDSTEEGRQTPYKTSTAAAHMDPPV